jgi:thiol-disulfide isomerase/thioredoxin
LRIAFNPKNWLSDYFKRKKPLSIFLDIVFIILITLILIPITRKEVSVFLIRTTAFPPSMLDSDKQFTIDEATLQWQLLDYNGNTYKFEDLLNKPIFVNFWATWCPPCNAELPTIADLYNDVKDQVNFILVSYEKPDVVRAFAKKHGYSDLPFFYAQLPPPDFESQTIPTTFIVTKNKKVVLKKTGAARWNSGKTLELLKQLNNN